MGKTLSTCTVAALGPYESVHRFMGAMYCPDVRKRWDPSLEESEEFETHFDLGALRPVPESILNSPEPGTASEWKEQNWGSEYDLMIAPPAITDLGPGIMMIQYLLQTTFQTPTAALLEASTRWPDVGFVVGAVTGVNQGIVGAVFLSNGEILARESVVDVDIESSIPFFGDVAREVYSSVTNKGGGRAPKQWVIDSVDGRYIDVDRALRDIVNFGSIAEARYDFFDRLESKNSSGPS